MDIEQQSQENQIESVKQYRRAQGQQAKQSSWFWQGRSLLTGQAIVSTPNGEQLQAQKATNAGLLRGQAVSGNDNLQQLAINARNFHKPTKPSSPLSVKPSLPTRKVIFVALIFRGSRSDLAIIGLSPEPEIIAPDISDIIPIFDTIKVDFLNDDQNWEVTYSDGTNYRYINSLGANISIPYDRKIFTISGAWAISQDRSFFRGREFVVSNSKLYGFFIERYPLSPSVSQPLNPTEGFLAALPILVSPRNELVSEIYTLYLSSTMPPFYNRVRTPDNLPYLRLKRRNNNIGGELLYVGNSKMQFNENNNVFIGIEDDFIRLGFHPFCGDKDERCRGTNYQLTISSTPTSSALQIEADLIYTRSSRVAFDRLSSFSPFSISALDNTLSLPSVQVHSLEGVFSELYRLRLALGYNELYTAIRLVLRRIADQFNTYSWYPGTTKLVNQRIRLTYDTENETMVIVITGTLIDNNFLGVEASPPEGSISLSSIMPPRYSNPIQDIDRRYNICLDLLATVLGSTVNYSANYDYLIEAENLVLFITCNDSSNIVKELYLSITQERFMPPNYYAWLNTRKTLGFFNERGMFFLDLEYFRGADGEDMDDDIIEIYLDIVFVLVYEDGEPIFGNSTTGTITETSYPLFSDSFLLHFLDLNRTSGTYSADGTGKITITYPLKTIADLNTELLAESMVYEYDIYGMLDRMFYTQGHLYIEPEEYTIKLDAVSVLVDIYSDNNEEERAFWDIYRTLPVKERLWFQKRYTTSFNINLPEFGVVNDQTVPPPEYEDYVNEYDISLEEWRNTIAGFGFRPLIMPLSNIFCIKAQLHPYPSFRDIRNRYNDYKNQREISPFGYRRFFKYRQLQYARQLEDTLPLLKPSYTYKTVWDGQDKTAWLAWGQSFLSAQMESIVGWIPDSLNMRKHSLLEQQLARFNITYFALEDTVVGFGDVVFTEALDNYDILISDIKDMVSRLTFYTDNYTFADYTGFTTTSNPDIRRTNNIPNIPSPSRVFGNKHIFDQNLGNQMLVSTSNSQSFFNRKFNIFGHKMQYVSTPKGGLLYPVFPTNVPVEFSSDDIQVVIFLAENQKGIISYSIELSEPILGLNPRQWAKETTMIMVLDGSIDLSSSS